MMREILILCTAELESVIEDKDDGTYWVVFNEPPLGEYPILINLLYGHYVDVKRYTVAIGLAGDNGDSVLEHVQGSPFNFVISEDGNVDIKPARESAVPPQKTGMDCGRSFLPNSNTH